MKPADVALRVKKELSSLTGLAPDTVSSIEKAENDWKVILEMVEMVRIPNSSDMLGTYVALADERGELVSYHRTRRYLRAESMEER